MKKTSWYDSLAFLILGSLYAFSIVLGILSATILEVSYPHLFLLCLGMLTVFLIIFYNKYTLLVFLCLLTISALLLYLNLESIRENEGFLYSCWVFLYETVMFIRGYLPYDARYTWVVVGALSILVSLYTTCALRLSFSFYLLTLLGIGVFATDYMLNSKPADFVLLTFLFCFCCFLAKKLNYGSVGMLPGGKRWISRRNRRNGLFTAMMMPICFLLVLGAYAIPVTVTVAEKKESAPSLEEPIARVNDFFYMAFNPKYFSFQTTGFAGSGGRLGGRITLSNRFIMEVYAKERLYMTGAVRDLYTGNAWINSDGVFQDQGDVADPLDPNPVGGFLESPELFEILQAASYARPNFTFDLSHRRRQSDSPEAMAEVRQAMVYTGTARTGTFFHPLRNFGLQAFDRYPYLQNDVGDMRAVDLLPNNASYQYSYLYVDFANERIKDILRSARKGNYQGVVDEVTEAAHRDGKDDYLDSPVFLFLQDAMAPYAQNIYDQYTALPDTVPERVHELALQVTEGNFNSYDKAKAIEEYLAQFPYTLEPATPPANEDFVDYFLFNGKEGYCTYYASAMVVMCRSLGIPARYVEGYIMPAEKQSNGAYLVTNRQAHSWAEVYFEGFGWVPFEATGPYNYFFYHEEIPQDTQVFSESFSDMEDYNDYMEDMGLSPARPYIPPTAASGGPIASNVVGIKPVSFSTILLTASALGLAMVLGLAAFRGLRRLYRRHGIEKMGPNQQAMVYYQDILRLTAYAQSPIFPRETPEQYATRMGKRFGFQNNTIFLSQLTEVYYRAAYGPLELGEKALADLKAAGQELTEYVKKQRGKLRFMAARYLGGKV